MKGSLMKRILYFLLLAAFFSCENPAGSDQPLEDQKAPQDSDAEDPMKDAEPTNYVSWLFFGKYEIRDKETNNLKGWFILKKSSVAFFMADSRGANNYGVKLSSGNYRLRGRSYSYSDTYKEESIAISQQEDGSVTVEVDCRANRKNHRISQGLLVYKGRDTDMSRVPVVYPKSVDLGTFPIYDAYSQDRRYDSCYIEFAAGHIRAKLYADEGELLYPVNAETVEWVHNYSRYSTLERLPKFSLDAAKEDGRIYQKCIVLISTSFGKCVIYSSDEVDSSVKDYTRFLAKETS